MFFNNSIHNPEIRNQSKSAPPKILVRFNIEKNVCVYNGTGKVEFNLRDVTAGGHQALAVTDDGTRGYVEPTVRELSPISLE